MSTWSQLLERHKREREAFLDACLDDAEGDTYQNAARRAGVSIATLSVHAAKRGRSRPRGRRLGTRNAQPINPDMVLECRRRRAEGATLEELGVAYNTSRQAIHSLLAQWTHWQPEENEK